MSLTNIHSVSELTATRELRAAMQGQVVVRGDHDYARTRKIWNAAVESQPALFAICETSADVQAAVRVARRHGLPPWVFAFTVRNGKVTNVREYIDTLVLARGFEMAASPTA